MHTVLGFSSILLVMIGCVLLLRVLNTISPWSQRRLVQSFILVMPIMTLGIGGDQFRRAGGESAGKPHPGCSQDERLIVLPADQGQVYS